MFNSFQCQSIYLNTFLLKSQSNYVLTIIPHKYPQDKDHNRTCLLTKSQQVHQVSRFPFTQEVHMGGEGKVVTMSQISFMDTSS